MTLLYLGTDGGTIQRSVILAPRQSQMSMRDSWDGNGHRNVTVKKEFKRGE